MPFSLTPLLGVRCPGPVGTCWHEDKKVKVNIFTWCLLVLKKSSVVKKWGNRVTVFLQGIQTLHSQLSSKRKLLKPRSRSTSLSHSQPMSRVNTLGNLRAYNRIFMKSPKVEKTNFISAIISHRGSKCGSGGKMLQICESLSQKKVFFLKASNSI